MSAIVRFFGNLFSKSSQQIETRKVESDHLLEEINSLSFINLRERTYQERKKDFQGLARKLLQRSREDSYLVDWEQFALSHCPGFIKGTPFEGGYEAKSINSFRRFIKQCLRKKGFFFRTEMSSEKLVQLNTILKELLRFNTLLTSSSLEALSDEEVEERGKRALQKVVDLHEAGQKDVYVPLGYREGTKNQGHSMSCKIRDDGTHVIVSLFNLGNGSGLHPVLNYTLDQKKISFAFTPLRISKELFFGKMGVAAFCHLVRYMNDKPITGKAYDALDIYDIFLQFVVERNTHAAPILEISPHCYEYEKEVQVSGTCSEEAVRCVIEDFFICSHIPRNERMRFFLNREFHSIMNAYHTFIDDSEYHLHARELLNDATRAFGAYVLRLNKEGMLHEKEFSASYAVVHEILRGIRKKVYPSKEIREVREVGSFSSSTFPISGPVQERACKDVSEEMQVSIEEIAFDPPRFTEDQFGRLDEVLRGWIQTAEGLSTKNGYLFVIDCLSLLPIPQNKEGDGWEDVTEEKIEEIVLLLQRFLGIALKGIPFKSESKYQSNFLHHSQCAKEFLEPFLALYTVYAITDKLVRRCKSEVLLDGFASPFFPPFYRFEPDGFTVLPFREDNARFSRLRAYFEGKNSAVIFPIGPVLPIEKYVEDTISSSGTRERISGANHVRYLSQFYTSSVHKKNTQQMASYLAQNWLELLPLKVRLLYQCVFFAHALFYTEGEKFPEELKFTFIRSFSGISLKIEDPFFIERKSVLDRRKEVSYFAENHLPVLENPIRDCRFELFQIYCDPSIKGSRVRSTLSFFSKEMKPNDAICYRATEDDLREWHFSPSAVRQLLYMTRQGDLALWQVIQFFSNRNHLDLLENSGAQQAFDYSVFQPTYLLERLHHEPDAVKDAFRGMIKGGLEEYRNRITKNVIMFFLLREGIFFETYIDDSSKERILLFYQSVIDELLKRPLKSKEREELLALSIFLENERRVENPTQLFRNLFKAKLFTTRYSAQAFWMLSMAHSILRKNAYKYKEELENDVSKRDTICRGIIEEVLQTHAPVLEGHFEGVFPQYTCGDITIDFFQGIVINQSLRAVLNSIPPPLKNTHDYYFQEDREELFWINTRGEISSLDGEEHYCPLEKKWFKMTLNESGVPSRLYLHVFDDGISELSYFLNLYHVFRFKDESGVITIYFRGQPYIRIEENEGKRVYTRVSKAGEILPYKLLKVPSDKRDPFYCYTSKLVSAKEVLCFVDTDQTMPHELYFYKAHLFFEREGSHLASKEFPGFYLLARAEDVTYGEEALLEYRKIEEEINCLEHIFILYNPTQKIWKVLIPISKVDQSADTFSRKVHFNRVTLKGYYEFDFDVKESFLRSLAIRSLASDEVAANPNKAYLSLALLFKLQRDYLKAYKYLRKLNHSTLFSNEILSIITEFKEINDNSVDSVAFNMNLYLLVVKNLNLMFESQFMQQECYGCTLKEFHQWGIDNYLAYSHFNDRSGGFQISEVFRLSNGNRKVLLLSFRKHFKRLYQGHHKGWESVWQKKVPTLHAQYSVLFLKERSNEIQIPKQKLSYIPPIISEAIFKNRYGLSINLSIERLNEIYFKFKSNAISSYERNYFLDVLPKYCVQLFNETIIAHLPELYERAKRCSPLEADPFDFTLHALLKVYYSDAQNIGKLLFFVRHFSDHFQEENLSLQGSALANERAYAATLYRIMQRANSLKEREIGRAMRVLWSNIRQSLLCSSIEKQRCLCLCNRYPLFLGNI